MKNTLCILFIISALASCKSKTKQSEKDASSKILTSNLSKDLIKKFKPMIQGVWVKADYVNKVSKTKSPLAASDQATGITIMYINTDNTNGDSIIVPVGSYNHDGSTLTLKFIPRENKSSIALGDGELTYSVGHRDTILTFANFDQEKKQFIKTQYIRTFKRQPNDDLADGIDYYINKILVAGNYTLTDSTGTKFKVNLSEDGKVSGFLNCKTYMINIDLNSDVNDNLDGIYFKSADKENKNFSFKINADTLSLYETYENADSTELLLGKLKYKLIRNK